MIAPSAQMMSPPSYAGEGLRKLRFLMTNNSRESIQKQQGAISFNKAQHNCFVFSDLEV